MRLSYEDKEKIEAANSPTIDQTRHLKIHDVQSSEFQDSRGPTARSIKVRARQTRYVIWGAPWGLNTSLVSRAVVSRLERAVAPAS